MYKFLAPLLFIAGVILLSWTLSTSSPLQPPLIFTQAEKVLATLWSPDETGLTLLHKTGKLTIYDVEHNTYRQLQTAARPKSTEDYCLFQSPDGQRIGIASFIRPHIILEIYATTSGRKVNHFTLSVSAKSVQRIKAGWHPTKDMILVGYTNENYLPGLLQAVDLDSGKLYPIIHNAEDFAFSRSNLVILTSEPGSPNRTLALHVTPTGSLRTTPVKLDAAKGKLVTFATSERGLYFTQRSVHNKIEKITANFRRNAAGRFKPAWSSAFRFPARYDAMQDAILPATENDWAAVTIVFGTAGTSGGRIWCVNKDSAVRMTDSNPNAYQMHPYSWQGRALIYNEASSYAPITTTWTDFCFDVITRRRTILPNAELPGESWSSISPRLKHIAIFWKEKEVSPWRLFIRPLDWRK